MTTERLLADPTPAADESPEVETTDEAPREGMTPTEWATGIRRLRRSVIVHDTGHLLAEFDELGYRIESAPASEDVDDLIDRYEALAEQIKGGVRYVAEQRSVDWTSANRKAILERLGLDKKDDLTAEEHIAVGFEAIASQIVEPADVTAESLRALYDNAPAEMDKVADLVTRTNATHVDTVESRDFSSRRSAKRSTRASSGR